MARGSGRAQFDRAGSPTIMINRIGGEGGGGNNLVGKLCPGTFTVNTGSDVGPLFFAKGRYLIYIPAKSAISCRCASVLFTRFLGAPGGALPDPWRVTTQTATFYKPAHPLRSAFPGRAGERRLDTTCPSLRTKQVRRLGQVVSATL